MEPITLEHLARAAGGRLVRATDPGGLVGPDVVIDSRQTTPGSVFVALAGERTAGHAFVGAVAQAGAGAALVERATAAALPQVVCPDAVAALSSLARDVVDRARRRGRVVVGVTGSSGKTSTKDLLAQVFEAAGPTVAPPGSFNNEIGAPLPAGRVDASTRYLVSEMGARGVGHIAALCAITPPTIGAVLNVGTAHLGEFGSVAGIAQAKGELVEALDADGWAVLNADDEAVAGMAPRTRARLALFSAAGDPGPDADLRVWASAAAPDALQRYRFRLHAAGAVTGEAPVSLRVMGEHQVANALAAAAVALAAGLTVDAVASGLSSATARSRWRMELAERADGLAVLNDSYNANPDSMAAALRALAGLRRPGGRLVAALGDMLELGPAAAEEHRRGGALARELGVDELDAVGGFGPDLVAGFAPDGAGGQYFRTIDELVDHLGRTLGPADVVLVKASRGLALDSVADGLLTGHGEGVNP